MRFQFAFKEYAAALYEALKEDAYYVALESSISRADSPRAGMLQYLDYSMVEAQRFGKLYLPADHPYGVSIWAKPILAERKATKIAEKQRFFRNHMGHKSLRMYGAIETAMSENAAPLVNEKSWYLSIVGVLPKYQGQGLGETLIRPVLEQADDRGAATYLETFTSRNIPFYERLGFEIAGDFHEPTVQADYWLMVR